MIRCVIIDDEPLAQDVLEAHVSGMPDVTLLGKFNNAPEALAFLAGQEADLVLLDIEMPEMTGIQFLKSLAVPPLTIFTTAYRDYAFEGFELGVIDFLLKPIAFARFSLAIDKVRDFIRLRAQNTQLEPGDPAPEYIFVKSGVKRLKLYFGEITHIQGLKDYAIIYTPAEKVVIKGSLKQVLERLPPNLFVRVHKSFIVSKQKIARIERNRILVGPHQVPVGRNYREVIDLL
ncbi:LytR/AlgR family response regulator transcription factor [Hufsiella ginkgonis]|uniref:Response regulator n=1 Tax=Hufsiella ginkgonis TaxID=2695274 RepID=A0A7K1Y3L3_9SPHI|nr:LytTR family DNA-binding domain-containing protein [Hufsiella ginkgonis]MXV17276.1 response regulator [Hufsiella ginkgonis]